MAWKCPQCEKELEENDATRGNCPYCFHVFDRPEEFQKEENATPDEEKHAKFHFSILNNDSTRLWLSVIALGFLLISLFMEIRPPAERNRPAAIKSDAKTTANPAAAQAVKEDPAANAIRENEPEIARSILLEYGRKTGQRINETLKQERLLEEKDRMSLGNLLGNPIGLAHTKLQSIYTSYGQAYLLLDPNNKTCGVKIVNNDITVFDTGFAREKLVIQPVAAPSLNDENTRLFNSVHAEPYEFLVSYVRSGKTWKIKEWTMVGTDWNFRPLPR